jgi:hypothetical protein
MICPECKDGFVIEPVTKGFVLSYRGFTKQVGVEVFLSCSNCLYESIEPVQHNIDIDVELIKFKREINKQLSTGDSYELRK